jgi:hypothetical protein
LLRYVLLDFGKLEVGGRPWREQLPWPGLRVAAVALPAVRL